jgi:LCP family protein required for cell wall assembly
MSVKRSLAPLLLLAVGLGLLVGLGASPEPEIMGAASTTAQTVAPTERLVPTSTATLSPTSIPTITPTKVSVRPSATASRTATLTSTPALTLTPRPKLTATPTPAVEAAGPTLAPTQTLSPTLTPSLTPTPRFSPTPLPTAVGSEEWLTILLIGLDQTENLMVQNTDVIILANVNKDTKQVSLLSIPRDLWVYIPTRGWSRINTAHKLGYLNNYPGKGPALLGDTIAINLGIVVDRWARIDFQGFSKVVDELGGIDITVACPINLEYKAEDAGGDQILAPGVYHMDGTTALRYVRTRRGSSDFDRARRQQQFLRAMWAQRKNVGLGDVVGLFSALTKSIETDLNLGDILPLASVALDLQPQHIRSRYIGPNQTKAWTTSDGWQVLVPRADKIQEVVSGLYAPPSAGEDQAAGEAAQIQVLNGTGRTYLIQVAVDELRWRGLSVTAAGSADRSDYANTQIIVFKDKPKALELLAQVLEVESQNISRQPDPNQAVDLQVILGNDYDPCQ